MKKTNLRILSFILALVILTLSLPTFPMVADAAEEEAEALEVGEEILTYTEEVELRDQFTKHFRRSDGQYVAVVYAEPVHAGERGNMTDIDNRLTYRASSGRYESANEEFAVSFAPTPAADRTVSVSFEGYTLSWRVDAVRNLQTSGWETMSVSAVTPIAVQPERASSLAAASVTDTGFVDASSLSVFTKEQISSTFTSVSKIRYQNAFTGGNGVDLSYTLAPNRLEEDIILKSKNDIRSYVLTMSAEGLTAVKQADNSILFVDGSGKEVFTVGAPWMQDAEYAFSDSITVSLVQKGDTVTVIYTPDAAWLNDVDRVYPVLIDPSVRSRNYTSNYEDGMITPTMTSIATTQTSTRVGTTGGYETYTKILSYPKLYSGMSVDSVTMSYYGSRSSINHKVRILNTEVDFASMTGANRPMGTATVYSPTVTLISSSSGSYYKHTYDITSAYQSYYYSYGYNALNYIKGFRLYNGDSTVTTGTVYTSSEGAADYRPVLEIAYTQSYDIPIANGGVYTLINKNSNKAMTVAASYTNAYQIADLGANLQAFRMTGNNGIFSIDSISNSGKSLTWDYSGYSAAQSNSNAYVSATNRADDAQNFLFHYVSTDNNGQSYYAILSCADTRYALTANGTSNGTISGTSVTSSGNIYMSQYTGSNSQLWSLKSGGKPVYVGNNIVENDGQTFAFDYGVGEPMIQPYGYVTAYGETISWVSSDPSVVSFDTNGKVTIHDIGEVTLTANVTGSGTSRSYSYTVVIAVENGVYYIRNVATGKYLGAPSDLSINKPIQLYSADEEISNALLWKVYCMENGNYTVRALNDLEFCLGYANGKFTFKDLGSSDTSGQYNSIGEWNFNINSVVNNKARYIIHHPAVPQSSMNISSTTGAIGFVQYSGGTATQEQLWELTKIEYQNDIALNSTVEEVNLGGFETVSAINCTEPMQNQYFTWTSSNSAVASVNPQSATRFCDIEGESKGTAQIVVVGANGSRTFSLQVLKKAIIIIPGIMGCDLYLGTSQEDCVEENAVFTSKLIEDYYTGTEEWYSFFSKITKLSCTANGLPRNNIIAQRNYDNSDPNANHYYGFEDTYKELYDKLSQKASNTGYSIEFFSFDWRMPVDYAAQELNSYVNNGGYGINSSEGFDKVVLLGHSMGGLIASHYLVLGETQRSKVEQVVFIGTPFLGTPVAPYILHTGDVSLLKSNFDVPDDFAPQIITLLKNIPSIYDLFPTQQYFQSGYGNSWYLSELESGQMINYESTSASLLNATTVNSTLLDAAKQRNNLLYANGVHVSNSVDSYYISSYYTNSLTTVCSFTLSESSVCEHAKTNYGDSMVPVWSASLGDRYRNKTYFFENQDHTLMVMNNATIISNFVFAIIANRTPSTSSALQSGCPYYGGV